MNSICFVSNLLTEGILSFSKSLLGLFNFLITVRDKVDEMITGINIIEIIFLGLRNEIFNELVVDFFFLFYFLLYFRAF